jgi:hypothetical protein
MTLVGRNIGEAQLSPDETRWIHARPTFFLPVKVLRQVFRGKLVAGLRTVFREGRLSCPGALQTLAPEPAFREWLRSLHHQPWVVYAKPPFGGPAHVLHYLARYTHRVAISNHRPSRTMRSRFAGRTIGMGARCAR